MTRAALILLLSFLLSCNGIGGVAQPPSPLSLDASYFQAYGQLDHQLMMLRDVQRMQAYRMAILGHPEVFRGKVVLDVGCGTGVLSVWAAQAGARKVHAVEARFVARGNS